MSEAARRFARDRAAVAAAAVLVVAVAAATLAPWIVPYDPLAINLAENYLPSSWAHPLGTDHLGRDTLSRLVAGARVSLGIAALSTVAGLIVGAALGLVAAWRRGATDLAVRQTVDILLSLPEMLMAIAIIAVLGRGVASTIMAVAVFAVPIFARLVRAAALAVIARDFVLAARAAGASDTRIIVHHLLPHCLSVITAQATIMLGTAILIASGLSFLGLGVQPPDPEWGAMLSRGRELLRTAPLGAVAPGVAITATVMSFSLVGDGLRDALDPRRR
jgi:ABC-type dipeptide/oligopeptide/nickel transport system permease subunit